MSSLKENKLCWTDTNTNREIKEWLSEKGEVIGENNYIKQALFNLMISEKSKKDNVKEEAITGFDF